MRIIFFAPLLLAAAHAIAQNEATAEYSVTFTGNWTIQSTPGGVVSSAHFTTLAIATHNSSVVFWESGGTATAGFEQLAELGATSSFLSEIRASPHSDVATTSSVGRGGTGTSSFTLTVKRSHPLFTFASMIGPSPDWFVGLNSRSLLNESNQWVSEVTIDLYPYDAGTEDGEEFSLSNPATVPQGVITSLRGVGKFSNVRMARIVFSRQDDPQPPTTAPFISSIRRSSDTPGITNIDEVAWLVSFSEQVRNVSAADFEVQGTTASVVSTTLVNAASNQYRINLRGGDLANLNGRISLGLSEEQDIENVSGVKLSTTLPTTNETYLIDNVAPTIISISPENAIGSPFTISIEFSEFLALGTFTDLGDVTSSDATVTAPVQRGTFYEITVTPDDPTSPGRISLTVDAGAATDIAGNDSEAFSGEVSYLPQSVEPDDPTVVERVSAITPDGTYDAGDTLEIGVFFSEAVTVVGIPMLNLQFDERIRRAAYARGSGTNTLSFEYTIQQGDRTEDLGYANEDALDLAGGRIIGTTGSDANLILPVPGSVGSLSQTSDIAVGETSSVGDDVPTFGNTRIQHLVFMVDTPIQVFQFPSATGGDGDLRYSINPALPAGLTLDHEAKTLSGTPMETLPPTEFTWTVTDQDGDSDSLKFLITVNADLKPVFATDSFESEKIYVENSPIQSFTLPNATGGDGGLKYRLTPELPLGLSRDVVNNEVSGTPLEPKSETKYSWYAEDEDGDVAILEFSITVVADLHPMFEDTMSISDQEYIQYSAIDELTLPSAQGGNGTLTYSLSPDLPLGLMLNLESYKVSGTPQLPTEVTTFVWRVVDVDGDEASIAFDMVVHKDLLPTFGSESGVVDQVFIQNSTIDTFTLPSAKSGNGMLTYSLTPELPAGLSLDMESFEVSGIPEQPLSTTIFSWRVVDLDGDEAVVNFKLTVVEDVHPEFAIVELDQQYLQNDPIEPLRLPIAEGGNGALTYQFTPAPPNGLSLDAMSRTISGTPSDWQQRTQYEWTATDQDGDSATIFVYITVIEDLIPAFTAPSHVPDQSFITGSSIEPVILPVGEGGNGSLRYRLEPDLPPGLTLDVNMRQISGIPTTPLPQTSFHWTVLDSDDDTSTIQFHITVLQDHQPEFRTQIPDQVFMIDTRIDPVILPAAEGGNGVLSYSLAPDLPSGLVLDLNTREITGTPTELTDPIPFSWTVEDIDGDAAELTFEIEVLPMPPMLVGLINPRVLYVGGSTDTVDARSVVSGDVSSWSFVAEDGNNVVALSSSQAGQVVLRPLIEGSTSISVIASNVSGTVNFDFLVTVATDTAENDQIDIALAHNGQALLSSTLNVFERRFLLHERGSSKSITNSHSPDLLTTSALKNCTFCVNQRSQDLPSPLLSYLPTLAISSRQSADFNTGFFHGTEKWSIWGALDLQSFSSGESGNEIDGSLSSQYLGGDWGINDNLYAGVAVARHSSDTEYGFASELATGEAAFELSLTSVYPYLQVRNGSSLSFYLVGGVGNGEASLNRVHASSPENRSDAEVSLFAGGFEFLVFQAASIDITLVGNAGSSTLALTDAAGILADRETSSGKTSLGGDVSIVRDLEEGTLISSLGLRALNESGDGETGTGFEANGSIGYWGEKLDVFFSGKVAVAHSGDNVKRSSLTARIRYKATTDGTGLGYSISPSIGTDLFQQLGHHGEGIGIDSLRRNLLGPTSPSIESEFTYGVLMGDQSILVTPGIKYGKSRNNLKQTTLNVQIYPTGKDLSWGLSVQGIKGEQYGNGFGVTMSLDL